MQELVLQWHKQKKIPKACKTCSCHKKDTWHVESKHMLQPPKYLNVIVNRFNYINDRIITYRSPIPLDLNIMLGPNKFNLRATVDPHVHSRNCGHYAASVDCCGEKKL